MATFPHIEVYVGPMFSGKTDALIARYAAYSELGSSVVALKAGIDTRHAADVIVSHSALSIPARPLNTITDLEVIPRVAHGVVMVDEVQFLGLEVAAALVALRDSGLSLVLAGLDRDFAGHEFESTATLIDHATDLHRLLAICSRCGRSASLTQRLRDGHPVSLDEPRVVIGDGELYEPRCQACWSKEREDSAANML